jgi:hypothetical protein
MCCSSLGCIRCKVRVLEEISFTLNNTIISRTYHIIQRILQHSTVGVHVIVVVHVICVIVVCSQAREVIGMRDLR